MKIRKLLFSAFFLIIVFVVLCFGFNIKADGLTYKDYVLARGHLYLNYDYLEYIRNNKEDNININYMFDEMRYYSDEVIAESITMYLNKQVYDSQYLELYLFNDSFTEPLKVFYYNDSLGDYVLNVFNYDFVTLRLVPFSEISIDDYDLDFIYFTTVQFEMNSLPYPLVQSKAKVNTWFTFNPNPSLFNDRNNYEFSVSGFTSYPILSEGKYFSSFDSIIFYTNGSIAYHFTLTDSNAYYITVYNNGAWLDNARYIHLNSTVSGSLYGYLLNNGITTNLQASEESGNLKDLIFAYADIPYKIVKGLTSFEILGYTLFAILGTIILVFLTIKIIKGGL